MIKGYCVSTGGPAVGSQGVTAMTQSAAMAVSVLLGRVGHSAMPFSQENTLCSLRLGAEKNGTRVPVGSVHGT